MLGFVRFVLMKLLSWILLVCCRFFEKKKSEKMRLSFDFHCFVFLFLFFFVLVKNA